MHPQLSEGIYGVVFAGFMHKRLQQRKGKVLSTMPGVRNPAQRVRVSCRYVVNNNLVKMFCKPFLSIGIKRVCLVLVATLIVGLPITSLAASIYNSDVKAHRIQITYEGGKQYFVTVYNSSTHYFDCSYGCQIKLIGTGHSMTLASDTVVLIDDGRLRLK